MKEMSASVVCTRYGQAHRRTPGVRRNANDLSDSLPSPSKLGNDLVVGKSSEGRMRPGVHRDLMSSHVLCLENLGARDDTRTNDEESSMKVFLVKVLQ